ncbi:MAG: hypothetical protein WBQ76_10980, partial [Candidatus Korobacteraceae bacterium]
PEGRPLQRAELNQSLPSVSNSATKMSCKSIPVLELRQDFKGFVIPTARQQLSREKKGDRHEQLS